MFQPSIFKIFISTHSLIKHIQCMKSQYIIHFKTHTKKLKTLIQGLIKQLQSFVSVNTSFYEL
jgi:hypothetical protein